MKLTIIGAAGVRTPLIVDEIIRRQDLLGISELSLLDINEKRLDLIYKVILASPFANIIKFKITRTSDKYTALLGADYVISTFRAGDIASRIIDELVPLELGFLGQETTGPGGFAMGMRTIPVLKEYVNVMKEICPDAWLINFTNPSGMMTEALVNYLGYPKSIGICDGPSSTLEIIAELLGVPPKSIEAEYFGLNHLGWFKSITQDHVDIQPQLIKMLINNPGISPLRIDPNVVSSLQMLPNEYLYYYYHSRQAVENLREAKETRGQVIERMNHALFNDLTKLITVKNDNELRKVYSAYINDRTNSYMQSEKGDSENNKEPLDLAVIGYARLALDLIEALAGGRPARLIINIQNKGSIEGMGDPEIVEVPAIISKNDIQPIMIGTIPAHCLGLIKQVKAFEHLTIEAALSLSYEKAVLALTIHPLVMDYHSAVRILDGYLSGHGDYFPKLQKVK